MSANFLGSGLLKINLDALRQNYKILQHQVTDSNCVVGCAVKANGYGCGIKDIAPTLEQTGCKDLFVATIDEGIELRDILKDASTQIYILGGLFPNTSDIFKNHSLTPVLNSIEEIEQWSEFNARNNTSLNSILHVDTAMNRLGLQDTDLSYIEDHKEIIEPACIKTVMSHFACADEKDHPLSQAQYQKFLQTCKLFTNVRESLANSSGIFRSPKYHFDLARPGMALYGLNPTPEQENPMKSVVQLDVPILQVREAKKGQTAGYGAGFEFEQDTKTATVSLGYADGYLRHLSNQGTLYYQNYACSIIGRVSMDTVIVNLSELPENVKPARGEMMEVIGKNQSADDIARDAQTIGYEILTSLGHRYRRIITNGLD